MTDRHPVAVTPDLRAALEIISDGRHPDGHRGAVLVARAALAGATPSPALDEQVRALADWTPEDWSNVRGGDPIARCLNAVLDIIDGALIGMIHTSYPMPRNAEEKGWNEAIHAARKKIARLATQPTDDTP